MHFPFFAIFLLMNETVTQELTLCQFPRINAECVLTCKTPDLKRTVSFIGQGDKLGSCDADFNKPVCSTFNDNYMISVNESAGETNLTINSLSKDENEGYWHCEYDKKQSERKKLQLYDIMLNTSLVSDPIVSEREGSITIHFQTDCLMPEPTTSLKCKNGEEMCKVSPFEKEKCEKSSLIIYNVTCNTTAECFLEKKSKVEIKVNDNIIAHKVIMYNKNEDNDTSHDGMSSVVPIIITVLVIIILATGLTLKFKRKIGKVCKCRKKDKDEHKLDSVGQNGEDQKINVQN